MGGALFTSRCATETHLVRALFGFLPVGHDTQYVEPALGAMVFDGQAAQLVAPSTFEKVPAGQSEHEAAPGVFANLPAGHEMHCVLA